MRGYCSFNMEKAKTLSCEKSESNMEKAKTLNSHQLYLLFMGVSNFIRRIPIDYTKTIIDGNRHYALGLPSNPNYLTLITIDGWNSTPRQTEIVFDPQRVYAEGMEYVNSLIEGTQPPNIFDV